MEVVGGRLWFLQIGKEEICGVQGLEGLLGAMMEDRRRRTCSMSSLQRRFGGLEGGADGRGKREPSLFRPEKSSGWRGSEQGVVGLQK